jgi:protocatechuate 3,4-dioxygenase beta subunit
MFPTRSRFRAVLCFIAVATVSAVAAVQLCAQTKAPASTIQGRLLRSNGKPLAYTEVELVPITSDRIIVDHRLNATSGSSGQFSFVGVPPGKYTLSINFDDKPTELSPYDTYFYPNAGDRSAAAVFDINESTRLKGIVFRLPSPLQKMRIAGRVIWADGAPVEGAWIGFWDA